MRSSEGGDRGTALGFTEVGMFSRSQEHIRGNSVCEDMELLCGGERVNLGLAEAEDRWVALDGEVGTVSQLG